MKYPQSYEDMASALRLTRYMKKMLNQFEDDVLNKNMDMNGDADSLNEVNTCFKDLKELLK